MSHIGVISDTHGILRPEAAQALEGSEIIIHAGDIGDIRVIEELRTIAPVYAIRGNVDTASHFRQYPVTEYVTYAGLNIYVLHNIDDLDIDLAAADIAVVVFGHSHQPVVESRHEILYFNPGSAGPKRFKLPIAVGRLCINHTGLEGEIITLLG